MKASNVSLIFGSPSGYFDTSRVMRIDPHRRHMEEVLATTANKQD
jgi:hypothetical protein